MRRLTSRRCPPTSVAVDVTSPLMSIFPQSSISETTFYRVEARGPAGTVEARADPGACEACEASGLLDHPSDCWLCKSSWVNPQPSPHSTLKCFGCHKEAKSIPDLGATGLSLEVDDLTWRLHVKFSLQNLDPKTFDEFGVGEQAMLEVSDSSQFLSLVLGVSLLQVPYLDPAP